MIKNVVFDMGRVLLYFDRQYLIDKLGLNGDDGKAIMEEVFCSKEWPMLDRGTLSDEDGVKAFEKKLPEHLKYCAEKIVMNWEKMSYPMPGMAEIVRELKENGYGIYLLSNASRRLHEYFNDVPGSECFDGMIVSADHKVVKPQNEIYHLLESEYGLKLDECVFIDDIGVNIEAAELNGMKGIVYFGDSKKLRRQLKELGVDIKL